jgi:hypothetical protein
MAGDSLRRNAGDARDDEDIARLDMDDDASISISRIILSGNYYPKGSLFSRFFLRLVLCLSPATRSSRFSSLYVSIICRWILGLLGTRVLLG